MKHLFKSCIIAGCTLLAGMNLSHASMHQLMPGINMEFILQPNIREEFVNISFQKMNGTCIITSIDVEGNDLFIEVKRKNGKVNDMPLSEGDNVIIRVHDKETLKLTAESGGKVALTNMGEHTVKAMCSSS